MKDAAQTKSAVTARNLLAFLLPVIPGAASQLVATLVTSILTAQSLLLALTTVHTAELLIAPTTPPPRPPLFLPGPLLDALRVGGPCVRLQWPSDAITKQRCVYPASVTLIHCSQLPSA